jgi:hypothetical protein
MARCEPRRGLEVRWIGHDEILGVWRDEFEVEYVHRHRLTGRAEPGIAPQD